MAEFLNLGANCDLEQCRKLDYTPFTCFKCKKIFCTAHRLNHGCENNEDQTIAVPKNANGEFLKFICSKSGCTKSELSKIECSQCERHFCMDHRQCEDHDCEAVLEAQRNQKSRIRVVTASEVNIKAPKNYSNPEQQKRADKIAIMRLKSQSKSDVASIFVFANYKKERFPVMLPKNWTVNRCRSVFAEKIKSESVESGKLKVFTADEKDDLKGIKLDITVERPSKTWKTSIYLWNKIFMAWAIVWIYS
uniref:AN1-type domain-containing protein n=1 Tax=Bursaphelenchus xylophilus TaxID=6326 RepID=A0A1I7S9R7_BURXY